MIKFLICFAIISFAIFALMGFLLVFFPVIRVCGYSMYPALKDGEVYIGKRVFRKTKCKVGKIYVFKPPYYNEEKKVVVKRLVKIKDGKYYFVGDNLDESYDSRTYGYVDCHNVIAVIKERSK